MKEAMAVTGYVSEKDAALLKSKKVFEIYPDKEVDEVSMRVYGEDAAEIRVGSSSGGKTLVQVILRDGAKIETVVSSEASPRGFERFHDPVINRIRQQAIAKVIMI